MDEIKATRTANRRGPAYLTGQIIGAVVVGLAGILAASLIVWAIVAIWRSTTGGC